MSAASFAPGIAPGGIATAFLNALNGVTGIVAADRLPLPTSLGGVTVRVNGEPAPLFAVGDATIAINGAEARTRVSAAVPAVFTFDGRMAAVSGPGVRGEPIEIYATGLGAAFAGVTVLIGGRAATVLFAGWVPGFVGLNQINAVVPVETPSGEVELVVRVGGVSSPAVRLPVR